MLLNLSSRRFRLAAGVLITMGSLSIIGAQVQVKLFETTERASVASNGAQGNDESGMPGHRPSLSANGRYVAFQSLADNLVLGDTNGVWDVFVRDTVAGKTKRVSLTSDGAQADWYSRESCISADGRYVAFNSYAANLVGGDTNGYSDVFTRGPARPWKQDLQ